MPNIREIETKPIVNKGILEIEDKVIDDILIIRLFIGPKKMH